MEKQIKIYINNDIMANTLRKIYKTQNYWQSLLDEYSYMNQFLENIDNNYIMSKSLWLIINNIFNEKPDGSFRKSLKVFGTRNKKRFIKEKLNELLDSREINYE